MHLIRILSVPHATNSHTIFSSLKIYTRFNSLYGPMRILYIWVETSILGETTCYPVYTQF